MKSSNQCSSVRYGAKLILLAAVLVLLYLYFVPEVTIETVSYHRVEHINNYPQPQTSSGEISSKEKIFLNDLFMVSVALFNKSVRSPAGLRLVLKFSGPVRQAGAGASSTAASETAAADYPQTENEIYLKTDRLLPLERRTQSILFESLVSGNLTARVELTSREKVSIDQLEIRIEPRPVSSIPLVPADIVSYLGDKAAEICKESFPCKNFTPTGNCTKYPDSPESTRCVADQNSKLFGACDRKVMADNLAWESCLMRAHGFL